MSALGSAEIVMPVADVNVGLRRFPWLLKVGARQRRGSGQGSANTRMNGICLNVMMNTSGSVTIQRIEVASMPLRIIWLERLLLRLGAMQHFKRHCHDIAKVVLAYGRWMRWMHTRQMYVVDSIGFLVLSIPCRLALLVIVLHQVAFNLLSSQPPSS